MIEVKSLIARLRRTLKDEDENSFTDEELLDYINDAVSFIRRLIIPLNPEYIAEPVLQETTYTNGNEIILPDNIQIVVDLRVNGNKIRRENINSIKNTREIGEPKCYCVFNRNKIMLYPSPRVIYDYDVFAITEQPFIDIDGKTPFQNDIDTLIFEYVVIRAGMGDMFQMSQELSVMGSIVDQVSTLVRVTNDSEDNFISEY